MQKKVLLIGVENDFKLILKKQLINLGYEIIEKAIIENDYGEVIDDNYEFVFLDTDNSNFHIEKVLKTIADLKKQLKIILIGSLSVISYINKYSQEFSFIHFLIKPVSINAYEENHPEKTILPSKYLKEVMKHYEKTYIEKVLQDTNGDKKKTADILNIGLSSLYRKMNFFNIKI